MTCSYTYRVKAKGEGRCGKILSLELSCLYFLTSSCSFLLIRVLGERLDILYCLKSNSYGIIFHDWLEGDELILRIPKKNWMSTIPWIKLKTQRITRLKVSFS